MAIPGFQDIMLPLLRLLSDRSVHSMSELAEVLAGEFGLTPEERKQRLPSGTQPVFSNRVGWARTYMKKAGLLSTPKRGYAQILDRGIGVLNAPPPRVTVGFLTQFPEFVEFRETRREKPSTEETPEAQEDVDPEEALERAYQRLRHELADDLLEAVKGCPPAFFERLVVELLVRMGYGGTRKDAGEAVGQSGDGGIDGIIKEDRLGLDIVYLQAKRWEGSVGRPEIQKFAGALQGQRARKGVFITTSQFTSDALDYASRIDSKVVLIDGDALAQLMIDHGVGVTAVTTYELKRLDSDYFEQLE
jgi:restriction system protein